MKKKWIIGICIGVILCCFLGIVIIGIVFSPKVYEGNHLKFEYDKSLKLTSREQKNGNNITAVNEDGTVEVSSIMLQLDDMDEETFFEYFEDDFANSKEFEVLAYEKRTANDGEGTEYYKEYEILGIDNDRYRALAQLQILDDDYYLYTLAYIQEDFDTNKKLAGEIMDSIVYSEVEDVGDLELTSAISALFEIDRFLISNVDNYVEEHDMYTEDLVKEHEEYMESIPADLTLKDVEGYEYLMQVDIASADGNIYPVMVPKEYDAEGEKRFITYLDNGFMLSMYAREFVDEETPVDFLEVCNDYIYESGEGFYQCGKDRYYRGKWHCLSNLYSTGSLW